MKRPKEEKKPSMDEVGMREYLLDVFSMDERVDVYCTFETAGLLTRNEGAIVRFDNGAEFHLTIVQSKQPDNDRVYRFDADVEWP